MATYRDRIVEQRKVKVSDLVPSLLNWRTHPKQQRDALAGVMSEVGNVDALTVRPLADGKYEIVDGHLRAELMPNDEVRVDVTDLTEQESKYVLQTKDPLAAMAQADVVKLDALLHEVQSGDAAVQEMLADLAKENRIIDVIHPDGFVEYDENIETEYCCPKCGYCWSGKANDVARS